MGGVFGVKEVRASYSELFSWFALLGYGFLMMGMIRGLIIAWILTLGLKAESLVLDSVLSDKDLTTISADQFIQKYPQFILNSSQKDSARVDGKKISTQFLQLPLVESVMRFESGQNELTLLLYSNGDSGEIGREKFEALVEGLKSTLTKQFKQPTTLGETSSIVRAKGLAWKVPAGIARLEWSSTRANPAKGQEYRSEFVRVVIVTETKKVATKATEPWLAVNQLRTNPEGDKWIGTVPMVDQGEKGYCAVAVSERIIRYYGKDADLNEIAQAMQTGNKSGTSSLEFTYQMQRIASRFALRFQVIQSASDVGFISDIVRDYLKLMKKKGGASSTSGLSANNFYVTLPKLDMDVLREVRIADKRGVARFEKIVATSVDRGEPLIWGVEMGISPEEGNPQAQGGHLRLIIGYNTEKREILYTDSWGPAHELKRMSSENAWSKTFHLYVMKP
jgi:hypothetical protein